MVNNMPKIMLPAVILVLAGVSAAKLMTDLQAFMFPTIILVLMLLASFGWLKENTAESGEKLSFLPVGTILLYGIALPYIGIWVSTLLFIVILQLILDRRVKILNLAGSVLFAGLLIILFQEVLAVSFPAGSLWG